MPDSITPNYSLVLPEIGASANTWGDKTNANWGTVDGLIHNVNTNFGNYLPLTGGTLSGDLAVGGYGINFINYYGGHSIAFGWDGSWLQTWVDNSYIGAMATTSYVINVAAGYLPLGGGTITGNLNVNGNIVTPNTVQGAYIHSTGSAQIDANLTVAGTVQAGYLLSTGNIQGGYIHSTGNIDADNTVNAAIVNAHSQVNFSNSYDGNFSAWANGASGWVYQFTSNYYMYLVPNGTSLSFVMNGGTSCWTKPNGDFHIAGNVYAANVSDVRTKRNVKPYRRGLAEICKLSGISWQHNGEGGTLDDGRVHYGWTAQDVRDVFPEAVYPTPEIERPASSAPRSADTVPNLPEMPAITRLPGQLSLDREPLMVALVNAVQELSAIATAQAVRIAALENRTIQ